MNSERLSKFRKKSLKVKAKDVEFMSSLLARLCTMVNLEIDEDEACEILDEFLKENELNVETIHLLGRLIGATKLNEEIHTVH